jgi:hypothetical protein
VREQPWERDQERRLIAACPGYYEGRDRHPTLRGHDAAIMPAGLPVQAAELTWKRRVPIGVHLANLRSKSYVAALAPGAAAAFLAAEPAALLARFPDGMVTENYRTVLLVVRTS